MEVKIGYFETSDEAKKKTEVKNILVDTKPPSVIISYAGIGKYTLTVSDTESGVWKITNGDGSVLYENYGTDAICYLKYNKDWQLLFSVILSAQCTDDRVNQVAVPLYEKYDKLSDWASFMPEELERKIYSIGFYRNKAKNIMSKNVLTLKK